MNTNGKVINKVFNDKNENQVYLLIILIYNSIRKLLGLNIMLYRL